MQSETLLVMTMALLPVVMTTGLWWSVKRRSDDELSDCLALASPPPTE